METKRDKLIAEIPWFVKAVSQVKGVMKISLLGSVLTGKAKPKDIDFLITVEDEANLVALAKLGRKLQGHTGSIEGGADVFLANPDNHYIGRTCLWRDCGSGIRKSCKALNCGLRLYLHDDFDVLKLSDEVVGGALQLWPRCEWREGLPEDLKRVIGASVEAGYNLGDAGFE